MCVMLYSRNGDIIKGNVFFFDNEIVIIMNCLYNKYIYIYRMR